MLKICIFHYNTVVAGYPVFVYVVSCAGRQVDFPTCTRNNAHKYMICCHNSIIMKYAYFQHVILAGNYMCSLMMISDMLSKHVGAVKVF